MYAHFHYLQSALYMNGTIVIIQLYKLIWTLYIIFCMWLGWFTRDIGTFCSLYCTFFISLNCWDSMGGHPVLCRVCPAQYRHSFLLELGNLEADSITLKFPSLGGWRIYTTLCCFKWGKEHCTVLTSRFLKKDCKIPNTLMFSQKLSSNFYCCTIDCYW